MCLHKLIFFFFNDTATTEIYTLSLHDALPIYHGLFAVLQGRVGHLVLGVDGRAFHLGEAHACALEGGVARSEEHTSELQSQSNLVCRLLLEKKKQKSKKNH